MTSSEENPFTTSHLNAQQQEQQNSLFLRGLQYVDVDKNENVVITHPDNTIEMNFYMQIVFACAFVLVFCLMICLSLPGSHAHQILSSLEARERQRRRRANECLPPKMDPEQRKQLVSKSLVIKHVMGAEEYEKYLEKKLKAHSNAEHSSHSNDDDADNDDGEDSPAETTKAAKTSKTAAPPPDSSAEKDKSNTKNRDDTKNRNSNKRAYRRLKSNLVVSSQDDLDSARDSREEPWMCAICLMEFELGDEICWSYNPNCRHVFHHECIEAWLMKHDECPCCRHNYLATTSSESERSTSSSNSDENGDDRDHDNTDSTGTHQSDYDYHDIESSGRPQ